MQPRAILISALALAAGSAAQQFTKSGPFNLIITDSVNSTLVGWNIIACHVGATTQGLCLTNDGPFRSSATFYHNATEADDNHNGPLIWEMKAQSATGEMVVESSMKLSYATFTDIAMPILEPTYEFSPISFDDDNKLWLTAYGDSNHREIPAGSEVTKTHKMDTWVSCFANVNSYDYHVLAWALAAEPTASGPCDAVTIRRTMI